MPEKISIVKDSGETINSNIVSVFMIPDTEKKYIITTENAVDPHGLTVLHVSEIIDGNLQKVATDEEWSTIKTIMRAIISGNVVSYQYLQPIETATASSQYSRDISVSASASKQMVDNYNAADKNTPTAAAPSSDSSTGPVAPETPGQPTVENPAPTIDSTTENAGPTPPQPNSIFPSSSPQQGGDEVIPGISEVSPGLVQPTGVGDPVVQSNNQLGNVQMGTDNNQANPGITPIMNGMMPEISIDPQTGMPIQAMPSPDVNPSVMPPSNEMNQMVPGIGFNNDVQVVDPTQGVPTGQIIQDATLPMSGMNMASLNMMPNINSSFNPNATLDEVVIASQEMFMEGVRNLVQTIQEKVYRDLYAREAAVKMREDAVLQKEQMLAVNPGMMSFNTGMMGINPGMIPQNNGMIMQNMGMQIPIQQQMTQPIQNQNMFTQQPNMGVPNQMGNVQQIIPNGIVPQSQGPVTVSASNDAV